MAAYFNLHNSYMFLKHTKYIFFSLYIKLPHKHYEKIKKKSEKKHAKKWPVKDINIALKKKCVCIIINDMEIFLKIRNKDQLSIEEIIILHLINNF